MSPRESAGGIIINPEGKLALVEQHGNSWSFPKGGVEPGESRLEAAVREIREETGIADAQYKGELGSYARRSVGLSGEGENFEWPETLRTFFLFATQVLELGERPHDPTGEITAARFVSIEEALELLTHPRDREFLRSVRSKITV